METVVDVLIPETLLPVVEARIIRLSAPSQEILIFAVLETFARFVLTLVVKVLVASISISHMLIVFDSL